MHSFLVTTSCLSSTLKGGTVLTNPDILVAILEPKDIIYIYIYHIRCVVLRYNIIKIRYKYYVLVFILYMVIIGL